MTKPLSQPAILEPAWAFGRSMTFQLATHGDVRAALHGLQAHWPPEHAVLGLGQPLVRGCARELPGLRTFPGLSGVGHAVPSTQAALWLFVRAHTRSEIFERAKQLTHWLEPGFVLSDAVDTFTYAGGRDLSGYEDGTENPKAEAAVDAALVKAGSELCGGSFAAVQRWVHDLQRFDAWPRAHQDAAIGRERDSNRELSDAPPSAHVKRSAQESFDPPAFMLRRSMPWTSGREQGLEFVAYGADLDRFERVLRRMLGEEDGIVDALFSFSRPVTGGYYFCPPLAGSGIDLSCLGL
jgi:putative iron-dependent peroxidase